MTTKAPKKAGKIFSSLPPNKIYFSKISDPEEWTDSKSYYFPFAEKLMRTRFKWVVLKYVEIRMFFEARP